MQPRRTVIALSFLLALTISLPSVQAAVVVLANRSEEDVSLTVSAPSIPSRTYTLSKGEVLSLPLHHGAEIDYSTGDKRQRCQVLLNEIYCFIGHAKGVQLTRIGLAGDEKEDGNVGTEDVDDPSDQGAAPVQKQGETESRPIVTVPVKIFVDQAEPNVQQVWEKRLRQRIKDASDLIEHYCRVRFEVVDAGTWESNEKLEKLSELLQDFRKKTTPGKARLAVGFTGLRSGKHEDHALGCTPGPLSAHIIIREYWLRTESEKLEVLVHELGHFLGACHSPEGDSVMRPKLGDGLANLRAYRMGFDPLNTLAINLVAEELARRSVHGLSSLRARTRRRLHAVFATLTRAMPQDPAPPQYVRLLGPAPPEPLTVHSLSPAVLEGVRSVVVAVTADAKQNQRSQPPNGDVLTKRYCRLAAAKCRQLPADVAPTAFTLGLAIALDRTARMRSMGLAGIPWSKIESNAERKQRLDVLGEPTMHGRTSLLRSFLISAAVATLAEGQAAAAAGAQEELLMLEGGDRFPFDDLMGSLAGSIFATQLDANPDLLDELATSFRVADYLPFPKGIPPPLDRDEFNRRFGSMTDERFLKPQDSLRQRLLALPGYRAR